MPFIRYLGLLACAVTGAATADPVLTDHVEAELVAENQSVASDTDNWLALRLKPEPGWHIYWRNPGDSGLPTGIDWSLPEGTQAGDLQWPYPKVVPIAGIVSYGYDAETLLPVEITVTKDPAPADPLVIKGRAHWLVCKEVCIPGSAQLVVTLPLAHDAPPSADPRWRDGFATARAELPQPAPADWKVLFSAHAGDFTLGVSGANLSTGNIAFFPYSSAILNHSAPPRLANDAAHGLRISEKLADAFEKAPPQVDGVLVVDDGEAPKAWEIHAVPGTVTAVPASSAKTLAAPINAPVASEENLPFVLLFALLGGLVLNLMPCVFPVLSIKAISVIEARGKAARRQRGQALAYTSGVLATFGGLAIALLVLRGSGEDVGWGFQLQQPVFIAGLADLFFAMGLSLSGVAQFGTRIMGMGQSLTSDGGYRGSFFTGVLAVAVASPCTAPFMGTALGYALGQPAVVAVAVFLTLGLGLALPFLLIGYFPVLGRWLPRPGAWMEIFKQAMAFPLYLTVIWLLWVLGGLTDRTGMSVGLLSLTFVALALWLWNRSGLVATAIKVVAIIIALVLLATPEIRGAPAERTGEKSDSAHEAWSEERLANLREQGKTVFVNFTADWCITCKVNERVALSSESVRKAFAGKGVVWLEGDWTRNDPAITQMLTRFDHSGVPLYLVYPNGGDPKVLPQVLTPSVVVDALK